MSEYISPTTTSKPLTFSSPITHSTRYPSSCSTICHKDLFASSATFPDYNFEATFLSQGPFCKFHTFPDHNFKAPFFFYHPSHIARVLLPASAQGPSATSATFASQTIPSIPRILTKLDTLKESSHLSLVINSPIITILQCHMSSTSYQTLPRRLMPHTLHFVSDLTSPTLSIPCTSRLLTNAAPDHSL